MRRSGRRRAALLVASLAVVALAVGILALGGRIIVGPQPVTRVAPDPWTATITIHSTALGRDMPAQVFVPPNLDPQVGQRLHSHQPDGQPVTATITAISDESVTLDGNHPLAGKDLIFEIELVEIV